MKLIEATKVAETICRDVLHTIETHELMRDLGNRDLTLVTTMIVHIMEDWDFKSKIESIVE